MNSNQKKPSLNPIPLTSDKEPIPLESVPDPQAQSDDENPEPISLAGSDEPAGPSKIQTFESSSGLKAVAGVQLKRPLNATGRGATRVRTFHTKLNHAALAFLDNQVNEWIDAHDDVEVKFCSSTIGVVEGKKAEPHLIITVWY